MAETPQIRSTLGRFLSVARYDAEDVFAYAARNLSIINFPTQELAATEARGVSVVSQSADIDATIGRFLVIGKGRIDSPKVRVWTFTLDGHDFYVLHLGRDKTLVYDTYAEQWYNWGSDLSTIWRAYNGCNWLDGYKFAFSYGSNVVVGDDGNGALYFLNPDEDMDDDSIFGPVLLRSFERIAQGQLVSKGYKSDPIYGVHLMGSTGETLDSANVNLSYSDNLGYSYVDAGTIAVPAGETNTRLTWRSLGSLKLPGRLFKIKDTGALKRIDALELDGKNAE